MKRWSLQDRETKYCKETQKQEVVSWAIIYSGNVIAILKDYQQARNLVDLHNKDVDAYHKLVSMIKKGVCSFLDAATS